MEIINNLNNGGEASPLPTTISTTTAAPSITPTPNFAEFSISTNASGRPTRRSQQPQHMMMEEDSTSSTKIEYVTGFSEKVVQTLDNDSAPRVIPFADQSSLPTLTITADAAPATRKFTPSFNPAVPAPESDDFVRADPDDHPIDASADAPPVTTDQSYKEMFLNRVPGMEKFDDEDDRFRFDVSIRPEQASLRDYENMPVDDFGKAMLRGMGWDVGIPIGRTNAAVVKPIESKRRPGYRLGLGATAESARKQKQLKEMMRKNSAAFDPDSSSKGLNLSRGTLINIVGGDRMGLFGVVKEIDAGQTLVRLHIEDKRKLGATEEWISCSEISVVNERQFPEDHSAVRFVKKVRSSQQFMNAPYTAIGKNRSAGFEGHRNENSARQPIRTKSRETRSDKAEDVDSDGWIAPNLIVRIVSKRYGEYYRKKGVVISMSSDCSRSCVVELNEDGKVLEDVPKKYLESVIPQLGGKVVILRGPHKLDKGTLVERSKGIASVRIDHEVLLYSFDDICEYK